MLPAGIRQYLLIGGGIALALFVALAFRWNALRAQHLESLNAERLAHSETKENYRLAQDAAQAKFDLQVASLKARNKELNDETDQRVADLRADYADRVRRLPKAAQCPSGSAGMSGPDNAQGADGSGRDTVLLDRNDALICAQNTARLMAAHDWAMKLMETE